MTAEGRRAATLVLSCILWAPVLAPTLRGELALSGSLVRYLLALAWSWSVVAGLHRLIGGYVAAPAAAEQSGVAARDPAPPSRLTDEEDARALRGHGAESM